MRIELRVTVEVSRESGKFASRDEVEQAVVEAVEGADFGEVSGIGADGESVYVVDDWAVEVVS